MSNVSEELGEVMNHSLEIWTNTKSSSTSYNNGWLNNILPYVSEIHVYLTNTDSLPIDIPSDEKQFVMEFHVEGCSTLYLIQNHVVDNYMEVIKTYVEAKLSNKNEFCGAQEETLMLANMVPKYEPYEMIPRTWSINKVKSTEDDGMGDKYIYRNKNPTKQIPSMKNDPDLLFNLFHVNLLKVVRHIDKCQITYVVSVFTGLQRPNIDVWIYQVLLPKELEIILPIQRLHLENSLYRLAEQKNIRTHYKLISPSYGSVCCIS